MLRFAIAFGVALAGLLSGGIEQIGKLDLIPVTLATAGLGFTAGAVKCADAAFASNAGEAEFNDLIIVSPHQRYEDRRVSKRPWLGWRCSWMKVA